jgi:hypothetical protein
MLVNGCCEEYMNEPGSVLLTTPSTGLTWEGEGPTVPQYFFYLRKSPGYSLEERKIKKMGESGEKG